MDGDGGDVMTTRNPELQKLLDDVRRQRDALRVRAHLAKADARDEWERLEHAWQRVRRKMQAVGREAEQTAEGVGTALRLAAQELRAGYARMRKVL